MVYYKYIVYQIYIPDQSSKDHNIGNTSYTWLHKIHRPTTAFKTQIDTHKTDVFRKFFVYWFIDTYMSDLRLNVFLLSIQPTVFLQKLLFRSVFNIWNYRGRHILWRQISLSPHHCLNSSFFSNQKEREREKQTKGVETSLIHFEVWKNSIFNKSTFIFFI